MTSLLYFVPILAFVSSLALYRHHGKREILRFDLVQFFTAFIIIPLMFIWLKSILFLFLSRDLVPRLSSGELFIADTLFSLVFMYVYAFIVIHSLTASFKLKKVKDPIYDIFHHSEYFHLWLSHLVSYIGSGVIGSIISLTNLIAPLQLQFPRPYFFASLFAGTLLGVVSYILVWLGDPKQSNFMRIMKLAMGIFFTVHVIAYFVFDPGFNSAYLLFWMMSFALMAMVFLSFFVDRSERATSFFDKFKYKDGWDFRVKLFE
jgi:hypothetical protein